MVLVQLSKLSNKIMYAGIDVYIIVMHKIQKLSYINAMWEQRV